MTYLDFFAELAAEATGTTKEQMRSTMLEYATNHEYHPILDKEVSPETVAKGRALIKSDPEGFRKMMATGFIKVMAGLTKH
jgi:hypothetical protein